MMGLYDYTIYSIIKRNATVYKDKVGFKYKGMLITHLQFKSKVDLLACGLLSMGVGKGDRIGIIAQNCLEFFYLFGAAAKIGAIILPINWRLNPEEIQFIIADGTPKVLFVESEFKDLIVPLISKFAFIEKCYAIGEGDENFKDFNDLTKNNGVSSSISVRSDDSFVIIYTAAVQGRPRGAILTHQNIILSGFQQICQWHLTREDVHITILPLFHVAGLVMALSVIQAGGVNIIIPKFDVDLTLKYIQEDKVTIFCDFPPILKSLLDRAEEVGYELSSLRIVGGLELPDTVKQLESKANATFWTGYGQTETSGPFCNAPYSQHPGSVGVPDILAEVEIVDDYGNILETGGSGEIVVRGPMVFKGYWNLKKDTEYTFRDGWHHTGDMGRFDEDGCLWYMGRTPQKDLIKSGGENVYPVEVERVILEHPLIEEAVVIGIPDVQWGEAIKAICVAKKGTSPTESQITEFVAQRIARFKKPKYVIFVPELPKADDGFIDRQKAKEKYGGAL